MARCRVCGTSAHFLMSRGSDICIICEDVEKEKDMDKNKIDDVYTEEVLDAFAKANGVQQSDFKKLDTGKNRLELIDPEFMQGLGRILTFGAEKYEANNWKKGGDSDNIDRIRGALLRHLFAYLGGQAKDPETGESHLYHATCNLMFLDYFDRNTPSFDFDMEAFDDSNS